MIRKIRYYIFLKDILLISLSGFGGPQGHLALFFDVLVKKRGYISEDELIELNALCQILPGPTSTQTLCAIGYKIGRAPLAYLTLIVWMLPAVAAMTTAAILITNFHQNHLTVDITRYIQPMAVGFVGFAAYKISRKVIKTKTSFFILSISAILSYFANSPFLFPVLLLAGGSFTAFKYKAHPIEQKEPMKIRWTALFIWIGILIVAAVLGGITRSLPIRLFENFYRNGSLIFGGGQVLIPFLYTEFVDFKHYLSSQEFLSGFGLVQAVPGPTFSFSAYVGALSMRNFGLSGEIWGGLLASLGIFLPGTFMIFFLVRFWDQLKKYRVIKASLEGITAVSSGMVVAAAFLLFQPVENTLLNFGLIVATFCLLMFTRIPAPFIIIAGLLAGIIF